MTTTLEIINGTISLPTQLHHQLEKRKAVLNVDGDLINIYVLPLSDISPNNRLKTWQAARGMWKNRKPDPIKELVKIRSGWDREI